MPVPRIAVGLSTTFNPWFLGGRVERASVAETEDRQLLLQILPEGLVFDVELVDAVPDLTDLVDPVPDRSEDRAEHGEC